MSTSVDYLVVYIVHRATCVLVSAVHLLSIVALGALRMQPLRTRLLPAFAFTLAIFMHNIGPLVFGTIELVRLVKGYNPTTTILLLLKDIYYMAIAYPLFTVAIFSVLSYSLRYFVIKMQLQNEKTRYYEETFRRTSSGQSLTRNGSFSTSTGVDDGALRTPRGTPNTATGTGDAGALRTPRGISDTAVGSDAGDVTPRTTQAIVSANEELGANFEEEVPNAPNVHAIEPIQPSSTTDQTPSHTKRIRVLRALASTPAMIIMILTCEISYIFLTILFIILEFGFQSIEPGSAFFLVTNIFITCCVLLSLGVMAMFFIDFVFHVPPFLKSERRLIFAKNYFLDGPYYWRAELSIMIALSAVAVVYLVGALCRSCIGPIASEIISWILTMLWLLYPSGIPLAIVSWTNFIRARRTGLKSVKAARSPQSDDADENTSKNEMEELMIHILEDKSRSKYRVFENYCMREFSQENVWCYREVQALKRRKKSRTRFVQHLRAIVHAYILKGSPLEVNLPHLVKQAMIRMLAELEQQIAQRPHTRTNTPIVLNDEHKDSIKQLRVCLLSNCYDTFTRFALQPDFKEIL